MVDEAFADKHTWRNKVRSLTSISPLTLNRTRVQCILTTARCAYRRSLLNQTDLSQYGQIQLG